MSGLRSGKAPSSDILDLARLSDGLMTESRIESAKRILRPDPARWESVDLRKLNGRRCGELGGGAVQLKVDTEPSLSSSSGDCGESLLAPSKLCSKMLNSTLVAPCKLRRLLLRGLPRLAASRFITPSLRLSGLDFIGDACSRITGCSSFSGPGLPKSILIGLS